MKFYKKYKPLLELNNSKFNVIALTGGRGSMKTGHALRGVLLCSTQAKKKTCFFRETKETLSDSLKAELDGIIETEFPNRGFSSTNDAIRHINGSYMFFKGLKEINTAAIENLKGIATTTDFFIIDEAQSVSQAVWDVLIPTLRKAGCVLLVIYNRIDDSLPVEDSLFLDYEAMKAPEGTYFIEVNYPEIQHLGLLSSQFIQRAELLRQHKPDKYERDYLNKPKGGNLNTVVKYFNKTKHIKAVNYYPSEPLHISCDFNVDPMCWVLAHTNASMTGDIRNPATKIYFIDEIVVENTNVRDTAREFLERYGFHKGEIIINGDASGDNRDAGSDKTKFVQLRNILFDYGYTNIRVDIKEGNPRKVARFDAFNNKMLTDAGEIQVYTSPKCKWLIYNYQKLCFKPGTSVVDKPTQTILSNDPNSKFLEHIFDAASYPIEYYWPVRDTRKFPESQEELSIQEQFSKSGR